jgi:hypothetical protein
MRRKALKTLVLMQGTIIENKKQEYKKIINIIQVKNQKLSIK